jgi:hypothetical protein
MKDFNSDVAIKKYAKEMGISGNIIVTHSKE